MNIRPPHAIRRLSRPMKRAGFTLVEVMIVLVILAILAAVAWPAYNDSVRKSRRAAAMSAIAKVMQAQERARSNRATYVNGITDAALTGAPATSEGGYYTLSTTTETATAATAYTVVATAGSSQSADTQCAKLLAVVSNGAVTYSSRNSADDAPSGADPCWVK